MSDRWIGLGVFAGLIACVAFTLACGGGGGGGGGGGVSALELPGRIAMTNLSYASGAVKAMSPGTFADAGTAYSLQKKESWADDTEALDMVNTILEVMSNTGYENFINVGPYTALVPSVDDSEQSQGGSSATSSTVEELQEIIVDVTRANNFAPMIAKIWLQVDQGPGDEPMLVRGYFEVTEGVSDQYPFGLMEAHFRGNIVNPGGSNDGVEVMQMAMSIDANDSGNVVVEFVEDGEEGADYQRITKVHVITNSDLSAGTGYIYEYEKEPDWEDGPFEDYLAYNDDYFKFKDKDTGDEEILSKAEEDIRREIFRYKLFKELDGSAVTSNSGFPLELAGGGHGYVGYYGLWTPHGVTLANGATVTNAEDGTTYTVFTVGGKLTKHTKTSTTLGTITDVEMSYWDEGLSKELIIAWNGTVFMTLGERNQNTWQAEYYVSPADDELMVAVVVSQWDGAWCDALCAYLRLGSLYFDASDANNPIVPTNASNLFYHTETTVSPTDAANMTLYCWEFALDFPIDPQSEMDGAGAAYEAYWLTDAAKNTYTFAAATMMLKDSDGDDVVLGSDIVLKWPYEWGYHLGPLTTDNTYTKDDHWNIWENAAVYYTWQTGPDQWQQFTTVVNTATGIPVSFDPPLQFKYTHTTANDANGDDTNNGKLFSLEYDGFQLNLPWVFDEDKGDWVPVLNLEDGTILTHSAGGVDTLYVVKGVEEELVMAVAVQSAATDELIVDTSILPPTLTYDAAKTDLVGAVPTGTELKVIKGELIE